MTLKQRHKTDKMAMKDTKMGRDCNSDKIKGKDMYCTIAKNTNKDIKQFLLNGQNERFWNSEIIHVELTNMYPIPCHKRASKMETQDRRCNFAQGRGDHKSWCLNGRSFCSMTEAHGNMLLKPTPCKQTVNAQLPQVSHSLTLDHSEMTFYFFLLNKACLKIPIMYSNNTIKYY